MPHRLVPSPHDRFTRKVFRRPDHAVVLLRAALPREIVSRLDFDSLRFVGSNLIDEQLREHVTDLLFSVRYAGETILVYVLIEHKSTYDRWTPLQVHRYKMQIWNDLRQRKGEDVLLPDILPLVLYHGDQAVPNPWHMRTLFGESSRLPEPFRTDDAVLVFDVGRCGDERLLESSAAESPMATLALLLLQSIRREDLLRRLEECADLIRAVLSQPRGAAWLRIVVRYVLGGSPHGFPAEEVRDTMTRIAGTEAGDIVMTTEEKLIAKGVVKERRDATVRILTTRFGEIPVDVMDRLSRVSDLDTLGRLMERAVLAEDLEDFRGETGR